MMDVATNTFEFLTRRLEGIGIVGSSQSYQFGYN